MNKLLLLLILLLHLDESQSWVLCPHKSLSIVSRCSNVVTLTVIQIRLVIFRVLCVSAARHGTLWRVGIRVFADASPASTRDDGVRLAALRKKKFKIKKKRCSDIANGLSRGFGRVHWFARCSSTCACIECDSLFMKTTILSSEHCWSNTKRVANFNVPCLARKKLKFVYDVSTSEFSERSEEQWRTSWSRAEKR